jgi:hypothetical protein
MADSGNNFPWVRQENETPQSYEAFKIYLNLQGSRSLAKVCEATGKSWAQVSHASSKYGWVERCRAYDIHVSEAMTDGLVNALAVSRDKNLALVDKLRDHLSNRLDRFIERDQDPSVRWTQALTAMARLETNCFAIKDDAKTTEKLERIEALIDRVMAERG